MGQLIRNSKNLGAFKLQLKEELSQMIIMMKEGIRRKSCPMEEVRNHKKRGDVEPQ